MKSPFRLHKLNDFHQKISKFWPLDHKIRKMSRGNSRSDIEYKCVYYNFWTRVKKATQKLIQVLSPSKHLKKDHELIRCYVKYCLSIWFRYLHNIQRKSSMYVVTRQELIKVCNNYLSNWIFYCAISKWIAFQSVSI